MLPEENRATATAQNLVKLRRVVFEICEYRQTQRQTYTSQYFAQRGEVLCVLGTPSHEWSYTEYDNLNILVFKGVDLTGLLGD